MSGSPQRSMSAHGKDSRTGIPRTIRALAVPIILVWVAFTAAVNLLVPQVEKVGTPTASPWWS